MPLLGTTTIHILPTMPDSCAAFGDRFGIARAEEISLGLYLVVITDEPTSCWEWILLRKVDHEPTKIVAQSVAGYGSAKAALRDGLLYAEHGVVLRSGDTAADPPTLGPADWIRVSDGE